MACHTSRSPLQIATSSTFFIIYRVCDIATLSTFFIIYRVCDIKLTKYRDNLQQKIDFQTNFNHYLQNGFSNAYTPASNLGYLAPPQDNFSWVPNCSLGPPGWETKVSSKKFWFGLCEIAWFLCQPIANLRRGVCL